jgi:tetraacyldisaccharide 4'-kinase
MDLERSILKIIRGEKKAPLVKAGLAALSAIYRSVLAARNFAYDLGWIPSTRLPVPVISIGNIVVGGTGKTPLVHLFASHLQDRLSLAILTRGFRSKIEKSGKSRLISSRNGPLCSPQECGDEPYFLAQKMKAAIWVGPDRVRSGQLAIEQGAQCLLLDDGMQHRRLKRDFEIVVIDGLDPFSKGRFLPWGLLRDSPKRLRSADLIVFTHVKDLEHYKQLQKQIALYSNAPSAAVQIVVINERTIARKVGIFCGIGKPERFEQTVRDLKCEIVNTLFLKDHEPIQNNRLQKFAKDCRSQGAEALLCTEKDYVKLYLTERGIRPDPSLCLKIEPVEIRLQIIAGKEHWEGLVKKLLDRIIK